MIKFEDKNKIRKARHQRIRNKISGTQARPRMNVYRSLNNLYVQLIDDEKGITLVSASTLEKQVKDGLEGKTKAQASELVGQIVAKRALEKGIKEVVFDRGGYLYTGRVAKIADAARQAGLKL
jgi:large subunit ribosomal protein L18